MTSNDDGGLGRKVWIAPRAGWEPVKDSFEG